MNTAGIRPMWANVLVLPDEAQEKTKGGLLIPDEVKDRDQFAKQEGVILAIGPAAFVYDWPKGKEAEAPKEGDRVFFSRYQAEKVRGSDGREYWLMKDQSIAGVMT